METQNILNVEHFLENIKRSDLIPFYFDYLKIHTYFSSSKLCNEFLGKLNLDYRHYCYRANKHKIISKFGSINQIMSEQGYIKKYNTKTYQTMEKVNALTLADIEELLQLKPNLDKQESLSFNVYNY